MEREAIQALLSPFVAAPLTSEQIAQVETYLDLLLKWNARVNLTAVRKPDEMIQRHFGESFFAAAHMLRREVPDQSEARLVDIGSGAGFPGLPFKIFRPALHVTLIEANAKKAAFLKEVGRALELEGLEVVNGRAENFARPRDTSYVTMRAVEKFKAALSIAINLAPSGSTVGLLIGTSQLETIKNIRIGVNWHPPVNLPGSTSRLLIEGITK